MKPIALLGLAVTLTSALAHAVPKIEVEAAAVVPGGLEVVVELKNLTDVRLEGTVEIVNSAMRSEGSEGVETPFAIGPHAIGRLVLQPPSQSLDRVVVRLAKDDPIMGSLEELRYGYCQQLVDLGGNTTLLGALQNSNLRASGSYARLCAHGPHELASGARPLPTTFAGYGIAAVVHTDSDRLLRMNEAELTALTDWALRGGTLAISVSDTNLHHARLTPLIGDDVQATSATLDDFGAAMQLRSESESESGTAANSVVNTRALLTSYRGKRLVPTVFGAAAAYGTGRVILLPFSTYKDADDAWVQGKLAELTLDASTYQECRLTTLYDPQAYTERKVGELDPNQNFRVPLGGAIALLLLYGGAVTFLMLRDHKQRRLFRMFVWLPGAAALTSLLVFSIGMLGRRDRRAVSRIVVVETAGGFSAASIDEYRGYFADGNEWLVHEAQTPGSVLFSNALGMLHQRDSIHYFFSRPQLPWQTTRSRELRVEQGDEHIDFGLDDVAVPIASHESDADAVTRRPWVTNRTKVSLHDLLVTLEDGYSFYLDHLDPGAHAPPEVWKPASTYATWHAPGDQPLLSTDESARLTTYDAIRALRQGSSRAPTQPTLLAHTEDPTPMMVSTPPKYAGDLALRTLRSYVHVVGTGGSR